MPVSSSEQESQSSDSSDEQQESDQSEEDRWYHLEEQIQNIRQIT